LILPRTSLQHAKHERSLIFEHGAKDGAPGSVGGHVTVLAPVGTRVANAMAPAMEHATEPALDAAKGQHESMRARSAGRPLKFELMFGPSVLSQVLWLKPRT
jgi:hypothetical protein